MDFKLRIKYCNITEDTVYDLFKSLHTRGKNSRMQLDLASKTILHNAFSRAQVDLIDMRSQR